MQSPYCHDLHDLACGRSMSLRALYFREQVSPPTLLFGPLLFLLFSKIAICIVKYSFLPLLDYCKLCNCQLVDLDHLFWLCQQI